MKVEYPTQIIRTMTHYEWRKQLKEAEADGRWDDYAEIKALYADWRKAERAATRSEVELLRLKADAWDTLQTLFDAETGGTSGGLNLAREAHGEAANRARAAAFTLGRISTPEKAAAARENGKLGGRPRKSSTGKKRPARTNAKEA